MKPYTYSTRPVLDEVIGLLLLAAVACFTLAQALPLLSVRMQLGFRLLSWNVPLHDETQVIAIPGAIRALFEQQEWFLGSVLLACSFVLPSLKIAAGFHTWFKVVQNDGSGASLGVLTAIGRWGFADVLVVALTVVVLKLRCVQTVVLAGTYAFGASSILASTATALLKYRSRPNLGRPTASPSHSLGVLLLLCLVAAPFSGCRRETPEMFTIFPKPPGLAPGAPVVWDGQEVGKVSHLETTHAGVRVAWNVERQFQQRIRNDIEVSVARFRNLQLGFQPHLRLIGGHNLNSGLIKAGDQIPLAADNSTRYTLPGNSWNFYIMISIVAVIGGITIWRLLRSLIISAAVVVVLILGLWMAFDSSKPLPPSPSSDARTQLVDQARSLLNTPEARNFATGVREQVEGLARQAVEEGRKEFSASSDDALNALSEWLDAASARLKTGTQKPTPNERAQSRSGSK